MYEAPLTFDIPVNHTVEKKGTSTVSIRTAGHDKSAFTIVFGCLCEWIVDAWVKVSALAVDRAFAKAAIISEQPPGNEADSEKDERKPECLIVKLPSCSIQTQKIRTLMDLWEKID